MPHQHSGPAALPLRAWVTTLFRIILAFALFAGMTPQPTVQASPPQQADADTAVIHYHRPDGNYDGWGLHVWEDTTESVTWADPLPPTGEDDFGLYWEVGVLEDGETLGFIVHKGDEKDPGPDQFLDLTANREAWILSGDTNVYTKAPDPNAIVVGNIGQQAAHWVDANTVLWDVADLPADAVFTLHYNANAGMTLGQAGVSGEGIRDLVLSRAEDGPSAAVLERFPHLTGYAAFTLPENAPNPAVLVRSQLAVTALSAAGDLLDATGLQIAGVLDDLFTYDGALGVIWDGDTPTLKLWAPTAKNVRLFLYADPAAEEPTEIVNMRRGRDDELSVWSVTGTPEWDGMYYRYEVRVFVPSTGAIETNLVTDPYSFSLSANSTMSQIVDLNDPALMPEGWATLEKPALDAFTDIVLYELHIRDFSVYDESVPAEERGTYLAFTQADSNGVAHLRALADAGLTHLHLLPSFDIATIDEDKANWVEPDRAELAALPPDSEEQQALIGPVRDQDGFNWGYDPFHYTVPEGSYSTDPAGTTRILEYRQMVQALNQMGLRVVSDVVYNHTNASGQAAKSVLDKIVPGYYHRLNRNGLVETSTCCANTATENAMMRKLMLDSLVTWATQYKIDGFRFDLMGHHMLEDMVAVRATLDSLTEDETGVDGAKIYVYGEGWDFGEVAGNARGVNATQINAAGTGIGTFNDRLRDAVRGVGPFDRGEDMRKQGFISGLVLAPNEIQDEPTDADLRRLLHETDWIRIGMAGNLRDYVLVDSRGAAVTGAQIDYNGAPAGYTLDPQEAINYASAHDNQTLFDALTYGAPQDTSMAERVKMQQLALSVVGLGQGVPFFHAGSDILRSKSFDRNSYNSGDWFNAIDWTYNDNNFGHGLPAAGDNQEDWPIMQPFLADPALKPAQADIVSTADYFRTLLEIRRSSPLFRLQTAAQVQEMVRFHNTGPDQIPGLIVQSIADLGNEDIDPDREAIFVLINARPDDVEFTVDWLVGQELTLHPLLTGSSFDSATGTFTVPGRTAAVFETSEVTETFVDGLAALDAQIADLLANPPALPEEAEAPAAERPAPESVSFPGTIGSLLGGADWAPDDAAVQAADEDGDGVWTLTATLPAGSYEFKAAVNGTWDENYGLGGAPGGDNIPLELAAETAVTFAYDRATNAVYATDGDGNVLAGEVGAVQPAEPAEPAETVIDSVSFPGNYAPQIGGAEWAPADPAVQAADEDGDGVWTLTVQLPGGDYEFKAAINGTWDVNYGLDGEAGGANVPLNVPDEGGTVTFSFDAATNAITVEVGAPEAVQEAPAVLGDGEIVRSALHHDSRSDAYRVPFGAVPENTNVVLRFRTAADDVEAVRLVLSNESTGARSTIPLEQVAVTPPDEEGGNGYAWWQININVGAAPTIHTYAFEIVDGDSVVYYNDNAGDGGLGNVGTNPGRAWDIYTYVAGFESPDWAKNAVIYQIFPDRFRNGNPDNDQTADDWFYPEERGNVFPIKPWNTLVPDPQPNDPGANPDWYATWNSTFYGGDLQGVIEKLDYLQELGVTAIYFNPIFESPSNHRYDGRTFDAVDDNLGVLGDPEASLAVLEELGRAAEERGMHLILDGVPNHLSSDAYIFDRYGRHDTEGGCEAVDSPYRDWFFFNAATGGSSECDGGATYEKWAGVNTLPQLDNTNPAVVENWLGEDGVAVRWLRLPGVDGWRIDVVPDVVNLNPRFFEQFRNVIKAEHPDAMLYSETWFEPDVRARVLGDEFDSTMNYRFRNAVLGFLRDSDWQDGDGTIPALDATEFDSALRALQEDYPPAAWQSAMNLLSSHDVNRALRVLDHDGTPPSGSPRDGGSDEAFEDGRQRLALAAVLQFTLPGAPTVYYGDEVGLVGFGSDVPRDDPYNRQPYPWPDEAGYDDLPSWRQQQTDLLEHYQFLGQLRGEYSFLRTGAWTTFSAENGLYVYGRKDDSGAAVIAVNRGDAAATVDLNLTGFVPLDAEMVDAVSRDVVETPISAEIAPMDFAIWITGPNTDLSIPDTPEIVSAVAGEGTAALEIDVADSTVTSVIVWRSAVDGGYESVAQLPVTAPTTVTYSEVDLPNGQPVYYRISAVKANGMESVRSAEVQLIPSFAVDAAQLLEPLAVEHTISAITPTVPLQGMLLIEGVTEADGAADGVLAELGLTTILPAAVPPVEMTMWIPGAYTGEQDGADVYAVQATPEMTGDYTYVWRFSTTGGADWVYADASGIVDAGGIVEEAAWTQPGALTVLPSDDVEAPNRPFRIDEIFASPSQIAIGWRASRTADLHAYAVCRRDVTAGEDDGCATRFRVPRDTQILTDTAVIINHIYEYTVQTVDTSFNASAPSDVLTVTAAENFVEVTFLVRVPDFTPADDVIVIAGDDRDIFGGEWNPVQPMVQVEENLWSYTVTVKEGTPLQYKYTRGSWETVEQWDTMTGMANRPSAVVATPEGTSLIDNTATDWGEGEDITKAVRNWRDPLVTGVSVEDGTITVTFNSAVVPTAEMGEVVTVTGADGATVPGAVAQVNETTFTFTPESPAAGTVTVTVFNVATDVPMVRPFEREVVIGDS
jgi:pullulanase